MLYLDAACGNWRLTQRPQYRPTLIQIQPHVRMEESNLSSDTLCSIEKHYVTPFLVYLLSMYRCILATLTLNLKQGCRSNAVSSGEGHEARSALKAQGRYLCHQLLSHIFTSVVEIGQGRLFLRFLAVVVELKPTQCQRHGPDGVVDLPMIFVACNRRDLYIQIDMVTYVCAHTRLSNVSRNMAKTLYVFSANS